jgi:hypothetical protein
MPGAAKENTFQKGENTMSKKSTKIEKKDAKITKGAKAPELSEQDLDKVAGGQAFNTTKSNVKTSA